MGGGGGGGGGGGDASKLCYVTVLTTNLRGHYAPIRNVCRVQQMTDHNLGSLVSVS